MVKIGNDVLEVWKSRHFGKLHKDRGPMATGGGLVEDSFVWFALRACSSPSLLLPCANNVYSVCLHIHLSILRYVQSSFDPTRLVSILRCICYPSLHLPPALHLIVLLYHPSQHPTRLDPSLCLAVLRPRLRGSCILAGILGGTVVAGKRAFVLCHDLHRSHAINDETKKKHQYSGQRHSPYALHHSRCSFSVRIR